MSELETLKTENEQLKAQMAQNSQGIHGLLAQVDAFKGELADSRTISLQLRTNLILATKSNNELAEKVKALEAVIAAQKESKSAEVPPPPLKEISKGK
jgi:predicted RNase H-like nuclease (RuvC/YqgF family)